LTMVIDTPSILDTFSVVRPCFLFSFICVTPMKPPYGLTNAILTTGVTFHFLNHNGPEV